MTRRTLHTRVALALLAVFVGLSLILAAWPTTPAVPLVAKSNWAVEGRAFHNVTPQRFEVRKSISNSPQVVYWRTWSPATLSTKANISTSPFVPSPYMVIPYGGFAGSADIELNLACVATNEKLAVATARTNTQMTEAFVKIPKNWCAGNVALDARSNSASKYIELGTPFKISRIDYYKNSFFGLVGLFVITFVFAWGLVLLPDALTTLYGKRLDPIIVGVAFFGLIGYVMFFVYCLSHHAGQIASAVIFMLELWVLLHIYFKRRSIFLALWNRWKTPSVLWFVVAISAFCLTTATHNGAGPWTVNALFKPVRWSSDNQLPMQISEYLFHGLDPRKLDLGPWKVSDRPPLAYGLMSIFRLISWLIANHSDGSSLFYQYELISGIVINGLWVLALYYLLAELKFQKKDICIIALVVGLTPFVIFNSVYIWPKMLGAAFALLAFTLLFEPLQYLENDRHGRFGATLLWAALLSGLALMSHGGTAFGVIAAIMISVGYRGFPSAGLAIRAIVIGLIVLIPWALWQRLEQPPGNALVKYAFSGNFGFGEESKSVLATIHDSYAKLTFSSWLDMKFNALRVLAVGEGSTCGVQETSPISSFYGLLRFQDFFYLGPSLRFLTIGFLPILFGFAFNIKNEQPPLWLHFARVMVCTGLLSVGLYTIFAFDCYINHMQSYQAMLEIIAGLAIALYKVERWYFALIIKISILYGVLVWVIDPLFSAGSTDFFPIITLCCLAVFIYYYICTETKSNSR